MSTTSNEKKPEKDQATAGRVLGKNKKDSDSNFRNCQTATPDFEEDDVEERDQQKKERLIDEEGDDQDCLTAASASGSEFEESEHLAAYFDSVCNIEGDDSKKVFEIGCVHEQRGDFKRALECFGSAFEFSGDLTALKKMGPYCQKAVEEKKATRDQVYYLSRYYTDVLGQEQGRPELEKQLLRGKADELLLKAFMMGSSGARFNLVFRLKEDEFKNFEKQVTKINNSTLSAEAKDRLLTEECTKMSKLLSDLAPTVTSAGATSTASAITSTAATAAAAIGLFSTNASTSAASASALTLTTSAGIDVAMTPAEPERQQRFV